MWSETVASALFGIELMTVACTPTMRPGARLCSLYGSFRKEGYRVNAARKASRASSGLFFCEGFHANGPIIAHVRKCPRDHRPVHLTSPRFAAAGIIGNLHFADPRLAGLGVADHVSFADLGVVEIEINTQLRAINGRNERQDINR